MKVVRESVRSDGTRRITYELRADETVLCVRDDMFYKLGYPVEDIMASHILANMEPVAWDSLEQRWIQG